MPRRFLNICKAGTSPQSPDEGAYYCTTMAYRTRAEAIDKRRFLDNVCATVEIEFEEEPGFKVTNG